MNEELKEKKRAEIRRSKPKKLVQRTLYSQVAEMNEKLDFENQSVYSEDVMESGSKRRVPKKKKANNGV